MITEIKTGNQMVILENAAEIKKNKTAIYRSSANLNGVLAESCAYYAAKKTAIAALKASTKKTIYNLLFQIRYPFLVLRFR